MIGNEILPKELTGVNLRRGKWTVEEERYTEKVIMDFENGTLDVQEGTTLRNYLSKVLHCDPMRITKKYTGNSSIGKRTFTPLVRSPENVAFIDMSQRDLEELRKNWISKLLLAEQWNNRKMNIMKNSCGNILVGGVGGMGVLHGNYDHHPLMGKNGGVDHGDVAANLAAYGLNMEQFPFLGQLASNTGSDNNAGEHPQVKAGYNLSALLAAQDLHNKTLNAVNANNVATGTGNNTGNVGSELLHHNGQLIKDETIYHALLPFVSDPVEIQYMINWLKASCHVLQQPNNNNNNNTSNALHNSQELQQLIKLGEMTLPALYKMMISNQASNSNQTAAKSFPYSAHPYDTAASFAALRSSGSNNNAESNSDQLEHLQKVIAAYFDHNHIPSDVANRVYAQPPVAKEGDDLASNESKLTVASTSGAKTDSDITPRKDSVTSNDSPSNVVQLDDTTTDVTNDRKRKFVGEDNTMPLGEVAANSALNAFNYPPYLYAAAAAAGVAGSSFGGIPSYRDYVNTFYRQKGLGYPSATNNASMNTPLDLYSAATGVFPNHLANSTGGNGPYGLPAQPHILAMDPFLLSNSKYAKEYYDHELKLAELQQRTNNAIQAQQYFLGLHHNNNNNNNISINNDLPDTMTNPNSIDMNQFNRLYQHNLSHRVGQGKQPNFNHAAILAGKINATNPKVDSVGEAKPKKASHKKRKLLVVPQVSNESDKVESTLTTTATANEDADAANALLGLFNR